MEALNINPTNLKEVIFFLLPGFIWMLLFSFLIPTRKKSDFVMVVLSVAISALLAISMSWIFSLINTITNLNTKLSVDSDQFVYGTFILVIISVIAVAKLLQSDFFQKLSEKFFKIKPFGRLWNDFFNLNPNNVVRVCLKNGKCYVGSVRRSSIDPNDSIQELELWKPLEYDQNTGNSVPIKETETMLIQANSIVTVEKLSDRLFKKIYPKV